jgi:zinc/manganese transport system substrate-binding protein/manganese/iron transport system substrate-binding protein
MNLMKLAAVTLVGLALGACGGDEAEPAGQGEKRLAVVATTMQLQDFARQVGGSRVAVTGILGPEDEPHEYEPKPSDAEALADADLVIENGANLDEWLDDLLANAGSEAQRVTAADGIDLLPTEDAGFPGDPHVWHDPVNAKAMVDNLAAGLTAADPEGRAAYARNASAYKRELDDMAERIRATLAPIPAERRTLITTHDAFGYFVRAYGIRQVGTVLASVSTEAEPSGRQVRELVEAIRAEKVKAIFTEEAVDASLERQIAEEAGAKVSTSLYADVLGARGSGAETYVKAQLANAKAMAAAWGR